MQEQPNDEAAAPTPMELALEVGYLGVVPHDDESYTVAAVLAKQAAAVEAAAEAKQAAAAAGAADTDTDG